MNIESITTETDTALSSQQTVLLDELASRLTRVQTELETKNLTIREQEADRIVKNYVLAGAAMGLVPLPMFDLVALSGTLHNMLEQLCQHYGVDFSNQKIRVVLFALLGGSTPSLVLMGMSSSFKFLPGIGTLGGSTSLSLLGGTITYAVGQSFIKHFSEGGTLGDVNIKKLRRFFRKKLK
jgi:uncharacterized protein (DUF697 family)